MLTGFDRSCHSRRPRRSRHQRRSRNRPFRGAGATLSRPASIRGPATDETTATHLRPGTTVDVEPFDPAAFPGIDERRRADGGAASQKWRDLIAANDTIIADGAMGTMLFANGLLFGDPPEVWNLSKPDIVRRVHRGYLDAGSQIIMTNTFGGNRMRLSLHGLQDRVAELNQTAAILLRSEVDAAGGTALVAGDIGPTGAILAPTGTMEYDEAVDIFAEQAAALVAGGVDLIWIETMSDLIEIKAAIEGVRRVSPGIALITTMTFDTRGHTMMGVSPEQALAHLTAWGADAVGGNCGNGRTSSSAWCSGCRRPDRPCPSSPSRTPGCPSSSTCAPSIVRTPRPWPAPR
jgi:5-methyltetrahydrofolate--homocysteine methyltransferase